MSKKVVKKKRPVKSIVIKYDSETGKCYVKCYNMSKRSEAYKVLQKATRQVRLSWGSKSGLAGIGIKSDRKAENILTAKLHREKVAKEKLERKKRIDEQNALLSGRDSKVKKLKDAIVRIKAKANNPTSSKTVKE